jgi:hypothetical protein
MPVILPMGSEKSWLAPNPTDMFMFPCIPELLTSYPGTSCISVIAMLLRFGSFRFRNITHSSPLFRASKLHAEL